MTPLARPAEAYGLTPQQVRLLAFIKSYMAAHGTSPSFDEMAAALGISSKSGVARLVRALDERGHIRRLPGRPRSLIVVEPQAEDRCNIAVSAKCYSVLVDVGLFFGMTPSQAAEDLIRQQLADIPSARPRPVLAPTITAGAQIPADAGPSSLSQPYPAAERPSLGVSSLDLAGAANGPGHLSGRGG